MSKEYLEVKDLQANFITCFKELLTKTDKDILVVNISRNMAQDMVNLYGKYLTTSPSKALELLKDMMGNIDVDTMYDYCGKSKEDYELIKKALIKSQEQEKVLKIIFEKNVDIYNLKTCISLEHYNSEIRRKNQNNTYSYEIWYELTQEDFELLKRWSNEQNN